MLMSLKGEIITKDWTWGAALERSRGVFISGHGCVSVQVFMQAHRCMLYYFFCNFLLLNAFLFLKQLNMSNKIVRVERKTVPLRKVFLSHLSRSHFQVSLGGVPPLCPHSTCRCHFVHHLLTFMV